MPIDYDISRKPMNPWVFFTVLLVALIVLYVAPVPAQDQPPRPRFEMILNESHDEMSVGRGYTVTLIVVHDREEGLETNCLILGGSVSCWPTGRKWK